MTRMTLRGWLRRAMRAARAEDGSIMLVSYFLIAALMGLAVPQTMRSMSAVRLETRHAMSQQLERAAEAGLDKGLALLTTTTTLGDPGAAVPACGGALADWDCAPTLQNQTLPGNAAYRYSVMVRNESATAARNIISAQGLMTPWRRFRVTAQRLGEGGAVQEQVTQELVARAGKRRGPQDRKGYVFEELMVGVNSLVVGNVEVYGQDTNEDYIPDGVRQGNVVIKDGGVFRGKIMVGPPAAGANLTVESTGYDICCDTHDVIYAWISPGGSIQDPNGATIANNANGGGVDTAVDWLNTQSPYLPFWMGGGGTPPPAPKLEMTDTPPACTDSSKIITEASGYAAVPNAATWTYCPAGDPDPACTLAQGDVVVDPDGVTAVEYCFETLDVGQDAISRFKGAVGSDTARVRIFAMEKLYGVGVSESVRMKPHSAMYSFADTDAAPSPATAKELMLNIPEGNTACPQGAYDACDIRIKVGADFYGEIFAPESAVVLGPDAEAPGTLGIGTSVVSRSLRVKQGAQLMLDGSLMAQADANSSGTPAPGPWVEVLAWRRCQSDTCDPALEAGGM